VTTSDNGGGRFDPGGTIMCAVRAAGRKARGETTTKEEKSDRERAAFPVKGAVSGAAIEAERLPCYATERARVCVPRCVSRDNGT